MDEIGTCDTCGTEYDTWSRDGRCGDCGECSYHCTHAERLPRNINVMRVVSYDVEQIATEMCDPANGWINGLTGATPTRQELTTEMMLEYIEGWIEEDFPNTRIKDLIIQDENGTEL